MANFCNICDELKNRYSSGLNCYDPSVPPSFEYDILRKNKRHKI